MKTYNEYIKENVDWNLKLMNSSYEGDLEGVKKALKNGADIHAMNDYSLMWAIINGHLEVVKYLVENGADIYADNDRSLRMSIIRDYLNVVRYLVSIYIERNKYKELLNHFDILPEKIREELKLKIPHIFAANDHGLI